MNSSSDVRSSPRHQNVNIHCVRVITMNESLLYNLRCKLAFQSCAQFPSSSLSEKGPLHLLLLPTLEESGLVNIIPGASCK